MCDSKARNLILALENSLELALTLNGKPLTTEEIQDLCQQVDEENEIIDPDTVKGRPFSEIISCLEEQVYQETQEAI